MERNHNGDMEMPIWKYDDSSRDVSLAAVSTSHCIYCKTTLDQLPEEVQSPDRGTKKITRLCICPACGWWTIRVDLDDWWDQDSWTKQVAGAAGSLKELDLVDITQPLDEVRSFLVARYEARLSMSPRLFEETVASVFQNLGYHTVVTALTKDDGIDVILTGPDVDQIGVQVKRWKNKVEVEQIRALAGALVLGGYTKGVFVTTSTFQAGAAKTVARLSMRGYPIELVDSHRLYNELKIAQISTYERPTSIEEYIKEYRQHLQVLKTETGEHDNI
jgi:restriction system protein